MLQKTRSCVTPRFRFRCLFGGALAIVICLAIPGVTHAAENMWTVQKLNDNQPWDRFLNSPIPMKIEGRVATHGGGMFRLMRCDVRFTIDNDKLRQLPPKANVEVKGRFKRNNGRIDFVVDELKVVPAYLDQFEVRASKLRLPTPQDWIDLGEWGMERGLFYEDDDLVKKARGAYQNAIEVEYKALKPTDAEGRFALAKKSDSFQLPGTRSAELIHEGLRIQYRAAQKVEPPNAAVWQKLAENISERLPGADQALSSIPKELKESYDREPDLTYQKSKPDTRSQLNRLLFIGATMKQLTSSLADDGSNGDRIAEQIEKLIPEEAETAERLRLSKLEFRAAHLTTANRSDVQNLAAEFRARQQNDRATKILSDWIKQHEARLRANGVLGLFELADEYWSLLNDEATAVECLTEAYRKDPTYEEISQKLKTLGYQFQNNRWTKMNAQRNGVVNPSLSQTEIRIGMPAKDLNKILGQPRSITRAITGRGTTEIWSFGLVGSSQLVVRLEKKNIDTEPKVVSYTGQ